MKYKKILFIYGTRPEAIKLAHLSETLRKKFTVKICLTGQHHQLIEPTLKQLGITEDFNLESMKAGQPLAELTAKIITGVNDILSLEIFDGIIVQGDTTSALAGSIAGSLNKIPVFHVEAGLRTYDRHAPFPEEINRQIIARIASIHFAPTKTNLSNLLNEGINKKSIYVTGNTGIDTLIHVASSKGKFVLSEKIRTSLNFLSKEEHGKVILVTCHRRENFGEKLDNIVNAIRQLADEFQKERFILPLHYNPKVRDKLVVSLSHQKNVFLTEPFSYVDFVQIMTKSKLIITDSGGIQEEAPSLNVPVVVIRNKTERIEAIEAETAILAGTEQNKIVQICRSLLKNDELYLKVSNARNPYGDGLASSRISSVLEDFFS